jgi:hypothetical protein
MTFPRILFEYFVAFTGGNHLYRQTLYYHGGDIGSFPVAPFLFDRVEMVADMKLLEQICIMFLGGLPTVNRSFVRHMSRVLREGRGQGGGIVVVPCLVTFFNVRVKLLSVLLTGRRFFLLGKGRHSKPDCQSYEGNY